MGEDDKCGQKEKYTKGTGRVTKRMDSVDSFMQTEICTRRGGPVC